MDLSTLRRWVPGLPGDALQQLLQRVLAAQQASGVPGAPVGAHCR